MWPDSQWIADGNAVALGQTVQRFERYPVTARRAPELADDALGYVQLECQALVACPSLFATPNQYEAWSTRLCWERALRGAVRHSEITPWFERVRQRNVGHYRVLVWCYDTQFQLPSLLPVLPADALFDVQTSIKEAWNTLVTVIEAEYGPGAGRFPEPPQLQREPRRRASGG